MAARAAVVEDEAAKDSTQDNAYTEDALGTDEGTRDGDDAYAENASGTDGENKDDAVTVDDSDDDEDTSAADAKENESVLQKIQKGLKKITGIGGPSIKSITGNQVATDGTYTSTLITSKYKYGRYDESYYGTLYVYVDDGKISGLYYSGEKSSKINPIILSSGSNYIGQPATVAAVKAISVDATSSASVSTGGSTGSSSSKKSYSMDLQSAILSAIQKADPSGETSSQAAATVSDGTYRGEATNASAPDYEKDDKISVYVTVSDGKITDVTVDSQNTVGDWDSLVETVKNEVVGSNAASSNVDAVSSATSQGWKAAIQTAIKNAIDSETTVTPTTDTGNTEAASYTYDYYDYSLVVKKGDTINLTCNNYYMSGASSSASNVVKLNSTSGTSISATAVSTGTSTISATADGDSISFSQIIVIDPSGDIAGDTTFAFSLNGTTKNSYDSTYIDADSGRRVYEVSGKKFEGNVTVDSNVTVIFKECYFNGNVTAEDSSAIADLTGSTTSYNTFLNGNSKRLLSMNGSNIFGTVSTDTELQSSNDIVNQENGVAKVAFPNSSAGKTLSSANMNTPSWATATQKTQSVTSNNRTTNYTGWVITGTTPSTEGTQLFQTTLTYGDHTFTVPEYLNVGGVSTAKVALSDDDITSETSTGSSKITVKKSWDKEPASGTTVTVTVKATDGTSQDVTLTSADSWTKTIDVDSSKTYSVIEKSVTNSSGTDISDQYDVEYEDPETKTENITTKAKGPAQISFDDVQANGTYVFLYTSGSTNYLLSTVYSSYYSAYILSGTEVSVDSDGNITSTIPDSAKWTLSNKTTLEGTTYWNIYNSSSQRYLRYQYSSSNVYGTSTYTTNTNTSGGSQSTLIALDSSDGSIWANTAYSGQNLHMSGTTASASTVTEFTAYDVNNTSSGGTTTVNTTTYTITNTEKSSADTPAKITASPSSATISASQDSTTVTLTLTGVDTTQDLTVTPDDSSVATATISGSSNTRTLTITRVGTSTGSTSFTISGKAASGYAGTPSATVSVNVAAKSSSSDTPEHVKSIKDNGDGTYNLSLSMKGVSKTETTQTGGGTTTTTTYKPVDVVLLLDYSRSITSNNALSNVNSSAKSFVNTLAGYSKDTKIAVVAYGGVGYSGHNGLDHNVVQLISWTDMNSASQVTTAIQNATDGINDNPYQYTNTYTDVNDNRGTNHAGAYYKAQTLLNSVSSDGRNKYVINISDGYFDDNSSPVYDTQYSTAMKQAGVTIYYLYWLTSGSDTSKMESLAGKTGKSSSAYVLNAGTGAANIGTQIGKVESTIESDTKQETTTPVTKVMSALTIQDTLSEYVDFAGTSPQYGVTVTKKAADGTETTLNYGSSNDYTVSVTGKVISINFNSSYADKFDKDATYTATFPVKEASDAVSTYETNNSTTLSSGAKVEVPTNATTGVNVTYKVEGDTDNTILDYTDHPQIEITKSSTTPTQSTVPITVRQSTTGTNADTSKTFAYSATYTSGGTETTETFSLENDATKILTVDVGTKVIINQTTNDSTYPLSSIADGELGGTGATSTRNYTLSSAPEGSGGTVVFTNTKKNQDSSSTVTNVQRIVVTKEWAEGTTPQASVTAKVESTDGSFSQNVTLNDDNGWSAELTADSGKTYKVTETSVKDSSQDDVTGNYTATYSQTTGDVTTPEKKTTTYSTASPTNSSDPFVFVYTGSDGKTYALGEVNRNAEGVEVTVNGNQITSDTDETAWQWKVQNNSKSSSYHSLVNAKTGHFLSLVTDDSYNMAVGVSTEEEEYTSYITFQGNNIYLGYSMWTGYVGTSDDLITRVTDSYSAQSFTIYKAETITTPATTTSTATYTIKNTINDDIDEPDDPSKEAGGLNLKKEADKQGQDVTPSDTVTLTLDASSSGQTVKTTTTTSQPADILLVFDQTHSLNQSISGGTTRLAALKDAASTFIDGIPTNSNSRIGLITFTEGGAAAQKQSWTPLTASAKTNLKTTINGLSPDGENSSAGTDYIGALNMASGMLTGSNTKYVVFFSDGDADATGNDLDSIRSAASAVKSKATVFSVASGGFTPVVKIRAVASSASTFYNAASASDLATAFKNMATTITEDSSTSNTTLGSSAVFRDTINTDEFDFSGATATVSIWDYDNGTWSALSGATASTTPGGNAGTISSWTNKATADGNVTITFTNAGVVNVTGFSYKDHYLPSSGVEATNPSVAAQRLHVVISGLKLKSDAQTNTRQENVHTNNDGSSGIYDGSTQVAQFPQPTVNIPAKESNTTSLTVKKVVGDDSPDTSKEFSFSAVVTPSGGSAGTPTTFSLKHNETYKIENIPVGASVAITEGEDSSYYISNIDESSGLEGTVNFTERRYTVTVPSTEETVTFTNKTKESVPDPEVGNDAVSVHKSVSKESDDGDNEFTITLSIDTKQSVTNYYSNYFDKSGVWMYANAPNDKLAIGSIVDESSINGGQKYELSTSGSGGNGTFTIYSDTAKKHPIKSGVKLYWNNSNNVCFYVKMPNNKALIMATSVQKNSAFTQDIVLNSDAKTLLDNQAISDTTTNSVTLSNVIDQMGAYITYQTGTVKENGNSNPTNVSFSGNTLTWTSPNKASGATKSKVSESDNTEYYQTTGYATLSYKIKLNVDQEGFENATGSETMLNGYHIGSKVGDGSTNGDKATADSGSGTSEGNWYNTNTKATLTYRMTGDTSDQTIDFPTPLVQGTKEDVPLTSINNPHDGKMILWTILGLAALVGVGFYFRRRKRI